MHGLSKGPQTKPDHTRLTETTPDHARPHGTIAADKDNSGRENRTCQNHFSSGILNEILAYPDSKTAGGKHANHIRNINKSIQILTKITSKILQNLIKMTSGTPSGPTSSKIPLFAHFWERPGELLGSLWGAFWVTCSNSWASVFRTIFKGVLERRFYRFLTDVGMFV